MPAERTDTPVDAGAAPIDLTESALSEQYRQAEVIHALGEVVMAALNVRRYARHDRPCLDGARDAIMSGRRVPECDCGFKEASENLDAKISNFVGDDGGISP